MTVAEAKVAVRVNSIVYNDFYKVRGYAYKISWLHKKDCEPQIRVGFHDAGASCVYESAPEDLEIIDRNVNEELWKFYLEKEQKKD